MNARHRYPYPTPALAREQVVAEVPYRRATTAHELADRLPWLPIARIRHVLRVLLLRGEVAKTTTKEGPFLWSRRVALPVGDE